MSLAPTKRLKYAVGLRTARVGGSDDDRPYVGMENVESHTGRLIRRDCTGSDDTDTTTVGDSLCNTFEPNDVLFGKLRPYLAKTWVAEFSGRCTTEFLVLTPKDFEPRYLRAICLSPDFVSAVNASTFGSKMPRADWDFIGNLRVSVPPLENQRAIVDHLDRETARIDALVAAKETFLRILAEKRRALITHAITRGLHPIVKLRDSGANWLGRIPCHWKVERTRWLFRERDERSITGEEELMTVSHITGVTPRSEKDVNMFEAETTEGYKLCKAGDLVINTLWAWMGAMGISPVDGLVSPAYNVYTPNESLVPAYVDALVRMPVFAQEVTRYSKGVWSSRLRLYPEGFYEVWLPVPPLNEQLAIVAHIASETARLDALRDATELTITLLRKRRSALIAAAVTTS